MLVKNIDTIRFHMESLSEDFRDDVRERLAKELFDRYPNRLMGDDLMIDSINFENVDVYTPDDGVDDPISLTVADVIITIVHKEPVRYSEDAINKLIDNAH